MALLLAQWSGLAHRIEHARLQAGITQQADSPGESSSGFHHSCLAFDAAAMADGIHALPLAAPLLNAVRVPALLAAFRSWDAPPVCHFSSRAPPAA